jgi:hypothetical protein
MIGYGVNHSWMILALPIFQNGVKIFMKSHRLPTPNEDINQRNLKNWADVADRIMLRPYLKIWDWDLIFDHAVKAISSLGVRSPWFIQD